MEINPCGGVLFNMIGKNKGCLRGMWRHLSKFMDLGELVRNWNGINR